MDVRPEDLREIRDDLRSIRDEVRDVVGSIGSMASSQARTETQVEALGADVGEVKDAINGDGLHDSMPSRLLVIEGSIKGIRSDVAGVRLEVEEHAAEDGRRFLEFETRFDTHCAEETAARTKALKDQLTEVSKRQWDVRRMLVQAIFSGVSAGLVAIGGWLVARVFRVL